MIKKNLFNKILKLVSILSIALTLSLMTFSFTAFAFTNPTNTNPKPITTVNFDLKGKSVAGNNIKLTFDSGETKSGIVPASGIYSINFDYPRTKGEILIEEFIGTVLETTKLVPYDITVFATDSKGNIIGPVLLSGGGEVPGTKIELEFEDGEIVTALVDSNGNFSAQPLYVKEPGSATSTGIVKALQYDGGMTTVAASQVTPPVVVVPPVVPPAPTPTNTPTPEPGIKPVATAASTAAKATVRSGGFLQIAGIIALFTVILAILIINKKFKR
jgi:hypothetical protein